MKSKINIHMRNITLVWGLAGFLGSSYVAQAGSPGWDLNSSSFSTNATGYADSSDGLIQWKQYADVAASYEASASELFLTNSGFGSAYVGYDSGDGGDDGHDAITSFGAQANANWTPSSGDGGPATTITAVWNCGGFLYTSNSITFSQSNVTAFTSSVAGAAGTITASTSAPVNGDETGGNSLRTVPMFGGNDVIDQDCYANITNVAEPVFTSKYASFSGEESSYGTDPVTWNGDTNCTVIWSRGSAYFAISLTNSYNAASGLTSISGSGSVTGVAVADVLFDDPIESMAYVEGQVSVDGSVTIQLQDTE